MYAQTKLVCVYNLNTDIFYTSLLLFCTLIIYYQGFPTCRPSLAIAVARKWPPSVLCVTSCGWALQTAQSRSSMLQHSRFGLRLRWLFTEANLHLLYSIIIHVEEASCVLVASHNGEIWVFYDRVIQGGLKVRERITLPEFSPCFHLVKVPHRDPGKVEVWGTMDHNRVLVLERVNKKWTQIELEASPGDLRLKLCSYIVHTSFTSRTTGLECSHTWVSYRNRSLLVGFDALTRKQRCRLNCADALRNRKCSMSLHNVCI